MGHPINFVSYKSQATRAEIRRRLLAHSYNRHELANALMVSQNTARSYLKALHEAGDIHISEWRPWHSETFVLACYEWGAGKDVPKPAYNGALISQRYREKIRADSGALDRKRQVDRERLTPEQKAEQYRRWKQDNPELYQAKLKAANEKKREARLARMLAQQEAALARQEAERQRAAMEALRAARREAKALPEFDRERYVAVHTVIKNPQPDPLVGLFFGMRA